MRVLFFQIKKTTLAVVLTFATLSFFTKSYGQTRFTVSGMYHTKIFAGEDRFKRGYGLNCQIFASDRIALEYNFSYVTVPNQLNYFKIHGGGILSARIIALGANSITNNEEGLMILALFSLLIPEGVSYHIPAGRNITVSPYINFLSFDFAKEYINYGNSFGVRMNMTAFDRINIAPFVFTQLQYRSRSRGGTRTGFGMGAMMGWRF